ncbi:MAG: response regulator transcription factor [bacterium]|nr:response regulator transcription factor [bacterium]
MGAIKVLVVDDQTLICDGIAKLLEGEKDIEVVGKAYGGQEAIEKAEQLKPDIILMDIRMPGLDGVSATKMIKSKNPSIQVIAISVYEEDNLIMQMFKAGAVGYVLKDISLENLVRAIKNVYKGTTMINPRISRKLLSLLASDQKIGDGLTAREVEVLREVAKGKSNREIGEELYMSESTVKTHISHIFQKLNIKTRSEAILYAVKRGLI